jgi:hypothetical protein
MTETKQVEQATPDAGSGERVGLGTDSWSGGGVFYKEGAPYVFARPEHDEDLEIMCRSYLLEGKVFVLRVPPDWPRGLVEAAHTLTHLMPFQTDMMYDPGSKELRVRRHDPSESNGRSAFSKPYYDADAVADLLALLHELSADTSEMETVHPAELARFIINYGTESDRAQAMLALAPIARSLWDRVEEEKERSERESKTECADADD